MVEGQAQRIVNQPIDNQSPGTQVDLGIWDLTLVAFEKYVIVRNPGAQAFERCFSVEWVLCHDAHVLIHDKHLLCMTGIDLTVIFYPNN